MKKLKIIVAVLLLILCFAFAACGPKDYVLNEQTFFLVMTNIQARPQQYVDSSLEFDCFTYKLVDVVSDTTYICGVRKCSAGWGCNCGNDTIIGFILIYDGDLPEPSVHQSENTIEQTWVHLKGKLKNADKLTVTINAYVDGEIDPNNTEQIQFLEFVVETCELIEDYSNLNYYVTK